MGGQLLPGPPPCPSTPAVLGPAGPHVFCSANLEVSTDTTCPSFVHGPTLLSCTRVLPRLSRSGTATVSPSAGREAGSPEVKAWGHPAGNMASATRPQAVRSCISLPLEPWQQVTWEGGSTPPHHLIHRLGAPPRGFREEASEETQGGPRQRAVAADGQSQPAAPHSLQAGRGI